MAIGGKFAEWEHLKELVEKVPRKSDIDIGLLIGANCTKALELHKIIPTKDGGPFWYSR